MQVLMEEQATKRNSGQNPGVSSEQREKERKRQEDKKNLFQRVNYFCDLAKQYLNTNEEQEQTQKRVNESLSHLSKERTQRKEKLEQ